MLGGKVAPGEGGAETYLVHLARTAMACEFEVLLNAGEHPGGEEAAVALLDRVDQIEAQLTVYRDTSEVARLNVLAAELPVPVAANLFALLAHGQQLSAATEGAFDFACGRLIKAWGFFARQGRIPPADELAEARALSGLRHVLLDAERRTVAFARPGVELNFGAIGKGYALDRGAEVLRARGATNFLVHGGQSSMLAGGSRAGRPSDRQGWLVAVRHPLRPASTLAEVLLRDRALGTSGSGVQFFFRDGRRFGHILDPRTGEPATGVLSSTVVAPQGAEADALSTAFFVGGPDLAARYCASRPEIGALLVLPGPREGALEIARFNLDETVLRLVDAR